MPGIELKAGARKLMSENSPKILFVTVILVVVATLMSELQYRLPGTSNAVSQMLDQLAAGERLSVGLLYSNMKPPGVALAALLALMRPVVEVGYVRYCMNVSRGEKGGYGDLLDGFLFFGKIIMIFLIKLVLILLWSLLLIVPGVIAAYRYRQAYYVLLDDPDKGPIQCIIESRRLMSGRKIDLFLLDFSFLGWIILDIIVTNIMALLAVPFPLPIVSIYLTPYVGLTRAAFYNNLVSRLAT